MTMNEGGAGCPHGGDRDRMAVAFLSGRLSGPAAEEFEAHAYACDPCFEAIELAASLHAATRAPQISVRSRSRNWGWAAAATVVLAVAIGYAIRDPGPFAPPEAATVRGVRDAIALTAARVAGGVELRWNEVQGVESYEARIFTAEGEPLFERRIGSTRLSVSAAELLGEGGGGPLYARVEGLDAAGNPVAQSALVPLPGVAEH